MSIIHELITEKKINIDKFAELLFLKIDNLEIEERNEGTYYYFYIEDESTRGVDFIKKDYGYELRNTLLSSRADYILANNIADLARQLTKDEWWTEEEEKVVKEDRLFTEEDIFEIRKSEASTVMMLLKNNDQLSFYGPIRAFHLGQRILNDLLPLEGDELKLTEKLEKIALNVQYNYPDSDTDPVMVAKKGDREERIKIIYQESSYVLDHYDYIALDYNEKTNEMLLITQEDLISISPRQWELLDEYTIYAPKLDDKDWNTLIQKAIPLNCFDEWIK